MKVFNCKIPQNFLINKLSSTVFLFMNLKLKALIVQYRVVSTQFRLLSILISKCTGDWVGKELRLFTYRQLGLGLSLISDIKGIICELKLLLPFILL